MNEIILDQLKQVCGAPDSAARFIDPLNKYTAQYDINTHSRLCGFIGQVSEESAAFGKCLEDITDTQADRMYGKRKDLGNTQPGDGARFKGRGLIQITGRNGYRDASMHLYKDLRLLTNPELLEQPDGAVQSACWYWFNRGLNSVMDVPLNYQFKVKVNGKPEVFTTYQWVTEKINGGQNGYTTRLKFFNKAQEIFPKDPAIAPTPQIKSK
jgi:putative chitinase